MSHNPYVRNPYDEVTYDSPPHSETRPENLYHVASLFGFDAVDFVSARVLELGCAAGSNIIPLAVQYPKATFVGIDYSQKQIEIGKQHIDNLQLNNIRLDCASIVDMGPEYGKFDYIIAHGVYSWVPDDVRDHVLRVCKQQLDQQGIALVSFNTYPGWKAVSNVRELMLLHTKDITDPIKKAAAARQIISFVKQNIPGENSPWAQELQVELDGPNFNRDYYILHDYLEENNYPVYFKDFMHHVKQHDLDYLTDLEFTTRSPYCLTGDAKKMILEKSEITDAEQYLDFIINRRFRRALICHQGIPKSREVTTKLFDRYKISSSLATVKKNTIA
jgi:2-polyprenyl-3-methyl-5-hydroxy-6-metoxy-1,4-benzoquinol methylase